MRVTFPSLGSTTRQHGKSTSKRYGDYIYLLFFSASVLLSFFLLSLSSYLRIFFLFAVVVFSILSPSLFTSYLLYFVIFFLSFLLSCTILPFFIPPIAPSPSFLFPCIWSHRFSSHIPSINGNYIDDSFYLTCLILILTGDWGAGAAHGREETIEFLRR